ncbi:MAG: hypothetical protein A4E25_01762 [Methanobacterium sp. PtaB.Bin024]|jgi:hypothetical protein|nr:MAG: hypothetical protein A4E25_01762 [Methanobacterium sp. PtaB.Bin024]
MEKKARLTLLDLNTNIVVNQKIVKEFNVKTVETFLKASLRYKKCKTIVNDGSIAYNHVNR